MQRRFLSTVLDVNTNNVLYYTTNQNQTCYTFLHIQNHSKRSWLNTASFKYSCTPKSNQGWAKGTVEIFFRSQYQYCVYTNQPEFKPVLGWCRHNNILVEVHLARSRFWIPKGRLHVEFLLRWGSTCPNVDHETDHSLGR